MTNCYEHTYYCYEEEFEDTKNTMAKRKSAKGEPTIYKTYT
jgi:hypothetical protein